MAHPFLLLAALAALSGAVDAQAADAPQELSRRAMLRAPVAPVLHGKLEDLFLPADFPEEARSSAGYFDVELFVGADGLPLECAVTQVSFWARSSAALAPAVCPIIMSRGRTRSAPKKAPEPPSASLLDIVGQADYPPMALSIPGGGRCRLRGGDRRRRQGHILHGRGKQRLGSTGRKDVPDPPNPRRLPSRTRQQA